MSGRPEHTLRSWICSRQASVIYLCAAVLVVVGLSLDPRPEAILGKLTLYDKAGHLASYVVLAFLAARAVNRVDVVPVILAFLSCVTLGALVEVIQPFVGRHRELGDLLVDIAGAAIGVTVYVAAAAIFSRRARRARRARGRGVT